jgi:hypothetical protein
MMEVSDIRLTTGPKAESVGVRGGDRAGRITPRVRPTLAQGWLVQAIQPLQLSHNGIGSTTNDGGRVLPETPSHHQQRAHTF